MRKVQGTDARQARDATRLSYLKRSSIEGLDNAGDEDNAMNTSITQLAASLFCLSMIGYAEAAAPSPAPPLKVAGKLAKLDRGPPTRNGIYVARGACPGEGCTFAFLWRVTERQPVYAAEGSARITGWAQKGDQLHAIAGNLYLKPRRGVVRKDNDPFKTGDVIYVLDPQGEGYMNVWRRGAISTWYVPEDKDGVVTWDRPADAAAPVWWVKVKRGGRVIGWLRNPHDVECEDQFSGDEGCVKAPD
jgi:hypothetical protein